MDFVYVSQPEHKRAYTFNLGITQGISVMISISVFYLLQWYHTTKHSGVNCQETLSNC